MARAVWSPSSTESRGAGPGLAESDRTTACRTTAAEPVLLPDHRSWAVRRRRAIWRPGLLARCGVTTVLLDIGGVVIPSLFESVALPSFPRGPLVDDPGYRPVVTGAMGEREYWAGVARNGGWDIGQLWRACSATRPVMASAVAVMLSRLPVAVFTNDMAHFFGADWIERFAELKALDAVIEATALGVAKPDPEAFRRAAAAVGETPSRCLLVDDHQTNLDGAARTGMATHLFDIRDPEGSVATLLRRLGLPESEPQRIFHGGQR